MKKRILVIAMAMFCMAFCLTSCSGGSLGVEVDEDGRYCTISAENAGEDDKVLSGSLIVGDNQKITVDQDFEEGGQISVKLIPSDVVPSDEDASLDDLEESLDDSNYTLEIILMNNDQASYGVAPGEYYISITVLSKATGSATLTVEDAGMYSSWIKADTAEAAAKGAGIDSFKLPEGAEIDLGTVKAESYQFNDNCASASLPFPAVDMFIAKGVSADGDVSGDTKEYSSTWTQDIDGLEVTCFGNTEGKATKTIWTDGDYSYSILAYGMGGDTDYGLSEEDLTTLIKAMK